MRMRTEKPECALLNQPVLTVCTTQCKGNNQPFTNITRTKQKKKQEEQRQADRQTDRRTADEVVCVKSVRLSFCLLSNKINRFVIIIIKKKMIVIVVVATDEIHAHTDRLMLIFFSLFFMLVFVVVVIWPSVCSCPILHLISPLQDHDESSHLIHDLMRTKKKMSHLRL